MPGPVSATSTRQKESSSWAEIVTRPPGGVYFTAVVHHVAQGFPRPAGVEGGLAVQRLHGQGDPLCLGRLGQLLRRPL